MTELLSLNPYDPSPDLAHKQEDKDGAGGVLHLHTASNPALPIFNFYKKKMVSKFE